MASFRNSVRLYSTLVRVPKINKRGFSSLVQVQSRTFSSLSNTSVCLSSAILSRIPLPTHKSTFLPKMHTRLYSTETSSNPAPPPAPKKKVAVILSGSGVYDGSEIHESVSILIHLSKEGVEAKCFAPDIAQKDVINHITGKPSEEIRNVLVESARIARGKVRPLSQLNTETYDAVIFPGGYGAVKNLSTFATEGEDFSIQPDVVKILKEFNSNGKPIGLTCVAPVIAAKLFPGVKVTVGAEDLDVGGAVNKMGSTNVPVPVDEICVDDSHKIVTTPAYMVNAPLHKIHEGIGKLVRSVLSLVPKRS
eukprot:TRINITY_DN326_c0_g1_i2.p1 TRINITY_DN326_c0_g1~~TRINITY_DN326_c0_g1_i2.p1  ORF type:complete len:307 (-),score=60.48 TRINITY_DN326_c0_g1_i2:165-1085(-)